MAEAGQAARSDSGQAAVDPFDPVALAARLAEARERRAVALAKRQADVAPDAASEAPRRPPQRGRPAAHASVPKPAPSPRPPARAHPGQERGIAVVEARARSGSLRAVLVPAGIGIALVIAMAAALVVGPPELRRAVAELIAPEYRARPGAGDRSGHADESEAVAAAKPPVAPAPAAVSPPAAPIAQARRSVSFETAALKAPPLPASAPGGAATLEVPGRDAPPSAPALAQERAPKRILQTVAVPAFPDPAMTAPRPVAGAAALAMRAGRDGFGGLREPPAAEAEPTAPPAVAILTEPADPAPPSPAPAAPERRPARVVVHFPPDAAPKVQSGDRAETAEAWDVTSFRPRPAPGALEVWPLSEAPSVAPAPAVSRRKPPAAKPAPPRVAAAEPRDRLGASGGRSRLNREVESMLKLKIRGMQRHR